MMINEVASRKKIELEQKVKALEDEFEAWLEKSESNEKFEKHHTQIRVLQAHLQGWHSRIRAETNSYKETEDPDDFLSRCANAEKLILSEHRIWDYFRSKFIQRNEELFDFYLKAADEFAWACYQPIQKAVYPDIAHSKRKEPPLVFFNGGISPFSISRDRTFQFETVAGENLIIDPKDIINKLPIPVVGIPWHQINYLPQALVIGHEVGHIIEDDFGLTDRLKELLDEAIDEIKAQLRKNEALEDENHIKEAEAKADMRKDAWHSWLGEIFADLYGCLTAGAAFAGTLIDFLIKESDKISEQEKTGPDWGRYPTNFLRIKIVLKALEVMNFADEIKDYVALWENYSSKMPAEFVEDIKVIVPKLLEGTHPVLNGKSVKEIFCFSREQQQSVNTTVTQLNEIKPNRTPVISSTQILVLFAVLRTAFEKTPAEYVAKEYDKIILNHIGANVIKPGVRSGEPKLSERQLKDKAISQEKSGEELAEQIFHKIKA